MSRYYVWTIFVVAHHRYKKAAVMSNEEDNCTNVYENDETSLTNYTTFVIAARQLALREYDEARRFFRIFNDYFILSHCIGDVEHFEGDGTTDPRSSKRQVARARKNFLIWARIVDLTNETSHLEKIHWTKVVKALNKGAKSMRYFRRNENLIRSIVISLYRYRSKIIKHKTSHETSSSTTKIDDPSSSSVVSSDRDEKSQL